MKNNLKRIMTGAVCAAFVAASFSIPALAKQNPISTLTEETTLNDETTLIPSAEITSDNTVKPEKTVKPEQTVKPEKTPKPEETTKPEKPAQKPDKDDDEQDTEKPDKDDEDNDNDTEKPDKDDGEHEIHFASAEEVTAAVATLKTKLDAGSIDEEEYVEEIYDLFDCIGKNPEFKKIVRIALQTAKKEYKINCIGVVVSGRNVSFKDFDDVKPEKENDRVLVPLRAVVQSLKAEVTYNAEDETIIITKGDITVKMTIGSDIAYVNGVEEKLDVPVKTVKDRTMVPLRFISEALNFNVDWDEETETVVIES